MKTRNKVIVGAVVFGIIAYFVTVAILGYYYFAKKPLLKEATWVYISPDTSEDEIYIQITKGLIDPESAEAIKQCQGLLEKREGKQLKDCVGAYKLKQGLPALQILKIILRHQHTPVKVTFNEVRLLPDLAGKMSRDLMCDSLALLNAMLDPEFIEECATDTANVICCFLPDTYEVYWDITPEKFVRKMFGEYKKFWNDERKAKAEKLGLTPKEVSIICSIAEEETQNRKERGVVARLYWNRLQIGMALQADPTVKFAIGDFSIKRVLKSHLEVSSPYNTYKVAGLPPGPIRIVEKGTINAFLDSQPHKWLYMCAKEDFSGTHNFADNMNDHIRNANRYHAALNKLMKK